MKKIITWVLSLMMTMAMSGCFDVEVSIDGDAKININEEHRYKAVVEDETVTVDAYKWEIVSSAGEYRLLNATSSEASFSASDSGNYMLKVTVAVEDKESTAELMIAVEEVLIINGHVLPPEPDPDINNATLLGIDSNDNGVRDDVERWIYIKYQNEHPVHIDIAMQAGRAWQKVLEDPTKAKEIHDFVSAPMYCEFYYSNDAKYFNEPILIDSEVNTKYFRRKIIFNTKERLDAFWQYDKLLSGDSYTLPRSEEMKQLCDFNISKYEK